MPSKYHALVLPYVLMVLVLILACAPTAASAGALADVLAAEAAQNRGDLDAALRLYTQALDAGLPAAPRFAALANRGNIYAKKGLSDLAVQDYDQAIGLKPDHANVLFNRGTAYVMKRQYDLAILDFDQVIKLNPDHAKAFCSRGVAYSSKRHYAQAVRDYDQAIKLKPGFDEALHNRDVALRIIGRGDKDEAPTLMTPEMAKTELGKHPGGQYVVKPTGEYATVDNKPMIALMLKLNGTAAHENDVLISQIQKEPGNYPPPILFALAALFNRRGQFDDALYWLHAGWLRSMQDATVCTDKSVISAVFAMLGKMPKDLLMRQFEDVPKLNGIIERVKKWDAESPYSYDRRWIAHSGGRGVLSGLGGDKETTPLLVPREQWDAMAKNTRVEYSKAVYGMMELVQKQRPTK